MPHSSTIRHRFHAWLLEHADEAILRWIFRSAVLVAIGVLAVDLASLNGWIVYSDPATTPTEIREDAPALKLPSLPNIVPSILAPLLPGDKRLAPLPQPEGATAQPMTFELVGGGRLMATGTITPGISQSFAAEAERHGEYIKTVVLNSPGGSVAEALEMGRLIRIRDRSRSGKILCVVVSPGVCRWRRSTRRRKGHDRRASDDSAALGRERPSPR